MWQCENDEGCERKTNELYWLQNCTCNERSKHQPNENKTNRNSKFNLLLLHIFFVFFLWLQTQLWHFPYIKLFHEMELNTDRSVYASYFGRGGGEKHTVALAMAITIVIVVSVLLRSSLSHLCSNVNWVNAMADWREGKCALITFSENVTAYAFNIAMCSKCIVCDNQVNKTRLQCTIASHHVYAACKYHRVYISSWIKLIRCLFVSIPFFSLMSLIQRTDKKKFIHLPRGFQMQSCESASNISFFFQARCLCAYNVVFVLFALYIIWCCFYALKQQKESHEKNAVKKVESK